VSRTPRVFVPQLGASGVRQPIDASVARRLQRVLRLRVGARLNVFDGAGREVEAIIADLDASSASLELGQEVVPLPEPPIPVIIACVFPRGQRGDWIVEKATELGAGACYALQSERAVMAPGSQRVERWRRIAIEAAEQCGRAVVPDVVGEAPERALQAHARLMAVLLDPGADASVREVLDAHPSPEQIMLIVGPEGGWTDAERAAWSDRGATPAHLGPATLRVETAVVTGLSLVVDWEREGSRPPGEGR
jgi:16S rRNA (uracil1498-N3)-methyltransferase